MAFKPLLGRDPLLKLIALFLLAFMGLSISMLVAGALIQLLWGFNFMNDQAALTEYSNPQIVHINRVLLLFQHVGLFIFPAWALARLSSHHWSASLSFRPWPRWMLFFSVAAMLASLPLINFLSFLNQQVQFPDAFAGIEAVFVGMEESAAAITQAITQTDTIWVLVVNILVVAMVPALGEELIFRAVLIPLLIQWTGKKHAAVWLSAIIFSTMHLQFFGFLPRMLLGLMLGYLFLWSRSIWPCIAAHFANNALALILLYSVYNGYAPGAIDTFEWNSTYLLVALISLACVIIFLVGAYKVRTRG